MINFWNQESGISISISIGISTLELALALALASDIAPPTIEHSSTIDVDDNQPL